VTPPTWWGKGEVTRVVAKQLGAEGGDKGPQAQAWRVSLSFLFEVCRRWSRVASLWRSQNRVPIKIIVSQTAEDGRAAKAGAVVLSLALLWLIDVDGAVDALTSRKLIWKDLWDAKMGRGSTSSRMIQMAPSMGICLPRLPPDSTLLPRLPPVYPRR